MTLLRERWVFALATNALDQAPYVTPLFYATTELSPWLGRVAPALVFASSPRSTHGRHLGAGPVAVGGAVYLESEAIGALRGLQLRGRVVLGARLPAEIRRALERAYLDRHPVAARVLAPADGPPAHALFVLAITWVKLTDNRVRFGHHEIAEFADAWDELDLHEPGGT